MPRERGPQLFFDDDAALVGNGGWKGRPEQGAAELGYAVAPPGNGEGSPPRSYGNWSNAPAAQAFG